MKIIKLLIFSVFLFACTNTADNPEKEKTVVKNSVIVEKIVVQVDSVVKKDSVVRFSKKTSAISGYRKKSFERINELGATNEKFNGEYVSIQENIPSEILTKYPDTIISIVKSNYLMSQNYFPRSIADDFINGISTERISYPKLNYKVELFNDKYSDKPYSTIIISVYKAKDGTLVAE